MPWKVLQYRTIFDDFYARCDEDLRVSIDNRLSLLMELGNRAREPVSKPIEDGIFELRAKNTRFLFYFDVDKRIIVVVAFFKDQRKLDRRHIEQAKRIRQIIHAGQERASGLHQTH